MRTSLLQFVTAGTGLVAGLFVAFAIAVMPALHGADARTFVIVMKKINVSIVNPLFLLLFPRSPVLLCVGAFPTEQGPGRRWPLVAAGLSVVALVVTFAINIPLNDRLAAAGSSDPACARERFEHAWNVANVARTLLMTGSFATCLAALGPGALTKQVVEAGGKHLDAEGQALADPQAIPSSGQVRLDRVALALGHRLCRSWGSAGVASIGAVQRRSVAAG